MIAPAKVNLCLRVLGRRADGFHDLWTIFDALEFGDELRYEPAAARGTTLHLRYYGESGEPEASGSGLPVPADESNLVLRAASAFREATGLDAGGRFFLDKHIPSGAGLGGGSSDAAAALRLLCAHHGLAPDDDAIQEIAIGLGADVPFFLHGRRAWADRRGDRIHPLPAGPILHYLLLFPGFPAPTGEVFARHDRSQEPTVRGGFTHERRDLSSSADPTAFEVAAEEGRRRVDDSLDASAAHAFLQHVDSSFDPEAWRIGFFNDLEPAATAAIPALGTLIGLMEQEGFPRFCLSGSGSTLFVASNREDRLRKLEEALSSFLANPIVARLTEGARLIRTRSLPF